jgi:hypothetical protein
MVKSNNNLVLKDRISIDFFDYKGSTSVLINNVPLFGSVKGKFIKNYTIKRCALIRLIEDYKAGKIVL